MAEKDKKPSDTHSPMDAGGANGQPVSPSTDAQSPAPAERGPGKEIPLGVPVSPEEYRKLKERAEKATGEAPAPEEIPLGVPVSPEEYRKLKERAEKASQPQQDAPADKDDAA